MYTCDICSKSYKHKGSLNHHCQKEHDGKGIDTTHKCKYCGKTFKTHYSLGAHVNRCKKNPKYESIKEKWRKKSTGRKHSKETKEKLSEIRSKIIEEQGKGGFKNIKWYKVKNIDHEEFICRGTWEKKVAKRLNSLKIKWVRKQYIKWIDNEEIKRTYTPDFYLPKYDLYIEVKGYFSNNDKEKLRRVKNQNDINICILFKEHMNKLDNIELTDLFEICGSIGAVL